MRDRADIRAILAKRAAMALFSDPVGQRSHAVRVVLAEEKDVAAARIDIEPADYPSELAKLNPYASSPVLVDRELVLFEPRTIMEYIDERFPHAPGCTTNCLRSRRYSARGAGS